MRGLNKIQLIGRLGKDPEIKTTQAGQQFARTSLAVDEGYTKEGRKVDKTEWFNLVIWGKLAEIAGQYLTKGALVYIEGKVQTREWQDQEGNARRSTEVVAQELIMLGEKRQAAQAAAPEAVPANADDLPF